MLGARNARVHACCFVSTLLSVVLVFLILFYCRTVSRHAGDNGRSDFDAELDR